MIKTFILSAFLVLCNLSFAQVYKDPSAAIEDRVNDFISKMTLNEKLDYVGGYNSFYIRSIPRLTLPQIKMSDGPVGVRNYGNTTAYPAGICLAATWDTSLVKKEGIALGNDARARGVHILLAPGINIYRAPMCGRNFEYFGEDPYLSGQIAASYINGVQSRRVVCTAKHYAANNQEWDRNNVSSDMDERTLREIYLPAFRASVKQGKVGSVMNSYNLINGVHATQNKHLNNEILKEDWNFEGFVMSDWVSTYNGLGAALGGLDLEMPSAAFMTRTALLSYINSGTLSEEVINDKVRRILRIIFRFGFYDNNQTDSSIPLKNPESDSIALAVARAGIVMLLNRENTLPLESDTIKSIAVIGPNADKYVAGGGSSYTSPFHTVTILDGIEKMAGDSILIRYVTGVSDPSGISDKSVFYTSAGSEIKGLTGTYYNNRTLNEPSTNTRIDTVIDFHWQSGPGVTGIGADNFSVRWTGVIRPDSSGMYEFIVAGDDGYRLSIGGEQIINNWVDQAITTRKGTKELEAGNEYEVILEYYENAGLAEIVLGYRIMSGLFQDAKEAAASSDVAVVCVGFNSNLEGEGFDRDFNLPDDQDRLINAVALANPNTIVILNAGGNVDMTSWIENVSALIHAWYPGQEGGTAVAEILFGKINPGGKLPVSFEKKWEDNPVYNSYYSSNKKVNYSEGIFLGYRYYTSRAIEPMFPFGYGLSYTQFSYNKLVISEEGEGEDLKVIVSADIKNTGSRKGSEVVQLYVSDLNSSVERPVKELKGFERVEIEPGQTKTVTMVLGLDAYSFFSVQEDAFVAEKGDFRIIVGSSSVNEELKGDFSLDTDFIFTSQENKTAAFNSLRLYPIPAGEVLNISYPTDQQGNIIQIFDLQGRLIDQFLTDGGHTAYSLSAFSEGLYVCRLFSGNQVFTEKFMVEK